MPAVCGNVLQFSRDEVAVGLTRGAFGSHAGIAFHSAKDGMQVLHLRFHQDLQTELFPPANQCWIASVLAIPKPASKQVVGIVRAISKRLPNINFGINFVAAKGSFEKSGRYRAPKGSDGLTCATFVCEVFRAAAIVLLREETWPRTAENTKWGDEVIELLKRKGASEEHIQVVRANNIGLRIRPEEVGVATEMQPVAWPLDFAVASPGVPNIIALIEKCCSHDQKSLPVSLAAGVATPSAISKLA